MIKADLSEEKKLWDKGIEFVIGIDEVGRGAFAGPVVVGAVVWDSVKFQISNYKLQIEKAGINDSKLLSSTKREGLDKYIKENCLAWDITEVSVGVINRIGIGKATEKAMRKSVKDILEKLKIKNSKLKIEDVYVLVDGFHVKYIKSIGLGRQKGIIKGDRKSTSIASASIVAKVYRDKLMVSLGKKYSRYDWKANKGYGTKKHRESIDCYGLTRLHRKAFVETWRRKKELAAG